MDEQYDAIVLGTGLTECVLSGLLSISGKKVLHMDRNDYYGGESASLNLDKVFAQFRDGQTPPESLGRARDYNIDLIPKFILADGILVKMLVKMKCDHYLELVVVEGSYVLRGEKIHKVPATAKEALSSSLMGFFEKRRCGKFLAYVQAWEADNPKTHEKFDAQRQTMDELYSKFGLEPDTIDFLGHSCALWRDDEYRKRPAAETIPRVQLYYRSLMQFGKSPYIYPRYGLGELPQAFSRLAAMHGGTYMLRRSDAKVTVGDDGAFSGVAATDDDGNAAVAKAPIVVGDPSYFPDKVKRTGQVVRAICLLDHPVQGTDGADGCQIIFPQRQVNRKTDMYIAVTGASHMTVPQGKYLAIVSTTVETENPEAELEPAFKLLSPILDKFIQVSDTFEPTNDSSTDKCYISKSIDPTSHFETTCRDVMRLYKEITGEDVDLTFPDQ